MASIDEIIIRFLNYTQDADRYGIEEIQKFWKILKRAREMAKEFRRKKIYRDAFKQYLYDGKSIFNHAILNRLELLPKILLEQLDVDPNSAEYDPLGRTSMHYVCEGGNMLYLKKFIQDKRYRIDYNARDNTGLIPLHIAILYGQTKIAYKMLKRVGVVENRDLFFGRSLHAAAYLDQISVVHRICARFPGEVSIVMPDRILCKAVSYTDCQNTAIRRAVFLLGRGANPDSFDEDLFEEPAVFVAAKKGWTDLLRVLVQRCTQIDDVPQWSVEGLMNYVTTDDFRQKDAERNLNKVKRLTDRMLAELRKNNVLAAKIICHSMRNNLEEIRHQRLQSLCKFFWELGKHSASRIEVDADILYAYAVKLHANGYNELASFAVAGALALEPDDASCLSLHEALAMQMAGVQL